MLVVCAEEAGTEFDKEHRPPDGEQFDSTYDALLGLHARACRTALEVFHLLSDGLPKGALSRSRTLHEIAVTAMVIAEYGRRPEYADLAERFLDHGVVANYKDARVYQEHCRTLGYEPFSDAEMALMKAEVDHAVVRYGRVYKEQYGWAASLAGSHAPTFRDLERPANVSHLRGHYSWASYEVHSGAKGWALNVREWGDRLHRETGYSNSGLADPGHMALISLHQSTVTLLRHHKIHLPEASWYVSRWRFSSRTPGTRSLPRMRRLKSTTRERNVGMPDGNRRTGCCTG